MRADLRGTRVRAARRHSRGDTRGLQDRGAHPASSRGPPDSPMPSGPGPAAAPALPRGICRTFWGLGNPGKGWGHPATRASGGLAACPLHLCCLFWPSQGKPDECPSVSGLSSLRCLSWRQRDPKGQGGRRVESWVGDRSLGEESGACDRPGRK